MIVYSALNKINGKRYIGITKRSLGRRLNAHLTRGQSPFQMALNKYGLQSFEITVIDEAKDWFTLCEKEAYWIAFHDTRAPRGYNLTAGGDGLRDPSIETRQKMSCAKAGRCSTDQRERLQRLGIARRGVKRPPNVGAAISASKMGKPRSPETIAKMRAANLGKKQSPETIAKRAAALRGRKRGPTGKPSWNRGKKTPLDVRLKQSVAARHRQSQHIPQQAYLSSEWVN